MSSLEKARQFAARKLTKLALAVVPLAAMVVSEGSAKATPLTFNPSSSGSFYGGDFGTFFSSGSTFGSNSITASNPNATAVTIFGSQNIFQSGGGQISYSFGASGTASGVFDDAVGPIPYSYDFTLDSQFPADTLSWILTLNFDSTQVVNLSGLRNNGQLSQQFTGSGFIAPTNSTISSYRFQLTVSLNTPSDSYVNIYIPAGTSLDLNFAPTSAVPEPGSAVLLVSAAGGILLLRRRKKS